MMNIRYSTQRSIYVDTIYGIQLNFNICRYNLRYPKQRSIYVDTIYGIQSKDQYMPIQSTVSNATINTCRHYLRYPTQYMLTQSTVSNSTISICGHNLRHPTHIGSGSEYTYNDMKYTGSGVWPDQKGILITKTRLLKISPPKN